MQEGLSGWPGWKAHSSFRWVLEGLMGSRLCRDRGALWCCGEAAVLCLSCQPASLSCSSSPPAAPRGQAYSVWHHSCFSNGLESVSVAELPFRVCAVSPCDLSSYYGCFVVPGWHCKALYGMLGILTSGVPYLLSPPRSAFTVRVEFRRRPSSLFGIQYHYPSFPPLQPTWKLMYLLALLLDLHQPTLLI